MKARIQIHKTKKEKQNGDAPSFRMTPDLWLKQAEFSREQIVTSFGQVFAYLDKADTATRKAREAIASIRTHCDLIQSAKEGIKCKR